MDSLPQWNVLIGIGLIAWGLAPWYRYFSGRKSPERKHSLNADIFESVALVGSGLGFVFGRFSFS